MKFTFITIFPQLIETHLSYSILKRAKENGVEYEIINLRDFTTDNYKTIDDHPYGGGPGMVMMIEPVYKALQSVLSASEFESLVENHSIPKKAVVLLTPRGKTWMQSEAQNFSESFDHIIFIIPHFEGIDERVAENLVTHEVSIGDYVLTGGELPALVIADSIVRLLPNILGNDDSAKDESFSNNLLEYSQYTRPARFKHNEKEWNVPDILLSGNHQKILDWRVEESKKITKQRRKDLYG